MCYGPNNEVLVSSVGMVQWSTQDDEWSECLLKWVLFGAVLYHLESEYTEKGNVSDKLFGYFPTLPYKQSKTLGPGKSVESKLLILWHPLVDHPSQKKKKGGGV